MGHFVQCYKDDECRPDESSCGMVISHEVWKGPSRLYCPKQYSSSFMMLGCDNLCIALRGFSLSNTRKLRKDEASWPLSHCSETFTWPSMRRKNSESKLRLFGFTGLTRVLVCRRVCESLQVCVLRILEMVVRTHTRASRIFSVRWYRKSCTH